MNVRDSLLNYFDKNLIIKELNSKYTFFYKNKTFAIVTFAGNSNDYPLRMNTDKFGDIGITIKPNDKKFIIYGLSGRIFCENDIDYCKSKKKEIDNDLKDFFGKNVEVQKSDEDHPYDKTGDQKLSTLFINLSLEIILLLLLMIGILKLKTQTELHFQIILE